MTTTRRSLITDWGLLFLCAPAIVRVSSLDLVRGVPLDSSFHTEHYPSLLKEIEEWLGYLQWESDPPDIGGKHAGTDLD